MYYNKQFFKEEGKVRFTKALLDKVATYQYKPHVKTINNLSVNKARKKAPEI